VFTFRDVDRIFFDLVSKPIAWGLLFALVYFFAILAYERRYTRSNIFHIGLRAVGFSVPIVLLAFVAGYLTGISRSAAVGTIVPAVLTFVGALNVYAIAVMGSGTLAENKVAVGYSVFLFAFIFFYGVQSGAYYREYGNENRILALSKQEQKIRAARKNLGLPEDPPSWLWSLEPK
jgi:hypothetical protein